MLLSRLLAGLFNNGAVPWPASCFTALLWQGVRLPLSLPISSIQSKQIKVCKIHFKSQEQAVKPSLAHQVLGDSDLPLNLVPPRNEMENKNNVPFLAAVWSMNIVRGRKLHFWPVVHKLSIGFKHNTCIYTHTSSHLILQLQ